MWFWGTDGASRHRLDDMVLGEWRSTSDCFKARMKGRVPMYSWRACEISAGM